MSVEEIASGVTRTQAEALDAILEELAMNTRADCLGLDTFSIVYGPGLMEARVLDRKGATVGRIPGPGFYLPPVIRVSGSPP